MRAPPERGHGTVALRLSSMGSNRRRWSSPPSAPSTPNDGGRSSGAAAGPRATPFRAHARKAVRTHLQAGWQQAAAIENIGLGGARVVVDNAIAPGDTVSLSFTAPTLWDPLVLRARVAWVAASPTSPSSTHPPQPGQAGHPAHPAHPA